MLGINGGIRLLGINEGDLREEDKRGGEDLDRGLILYWKFLQEGKEEEENWENKWFWKLSQGTIVARNFGLGG